MDGARRWQLGFGVGGAWGVQADLKIGRYGRKERPASEGGPYGAEGRSEGRPVDLFNVWVF